MTRHNKFIIFCITVFLVCCMLSGCSKGKNGNSNKNKNAKPKSVQEIVDNTPRKDIVTGYVQGSEILNNNGRCEFTLDNKRSEIPLYIRIWDANKDKPVRCITLKGYDAFEIKDLDEGTYELRYKDLLEKNREKDNEEMGTEIIVSRLKPFKAKENPKQKKEKDKENGIQTEGIKLTSRGGIIFYFKGGYGKRVRTDIIDAAKI